MSGTSIQSFRHLERQNPSIISESIGIPNGSENGKKSEESWRNTEEEGESYSYRRGFAILREISYGRSYKMADDTTLLFHRPAGSGQITE